MRAEALFDVRGHVTIVTGAASGLGLAMAEVMAENGSVVAMLDIDAVGLDAAATRLKEAGHVVEAIGLDVGDTTRLRATIDAVAQKHGRLDVVFLHVNLTSVFVTLQAAAGRMKAQRSGRIIVTSSIGGIRAERMVGYAYAATKAAVNNLVRQAALELAPYNVLVNAIAPGPFLTNIAGGRLHREPETVQKFADMVPLGRIARPDELKGLALLLASPASSFITGAVIPIDGGATAG